MQIPPFSLAATIPLCRLVYLLLHFSDVFQGISFSPDALFHENMRETALKSPRKLVSPITSSSIPLWSSLSFIPPRARLPANLSWLWFDRESHVPISTAIYGLSDLGPLSLMAMQYIKQLTWAPHQCPSCVSFSVTVCYIAMKFRGKILTLARSVNSRSTLHESSRWVWLIFPLNHFKWVHLLLMCCTKAQENHI